MQRRSTGIRNLDFKAYKQLLIPLPKLAEQKRIVAILDEAFAAIAKAKENAEKNLANARELFESYLNRVFTERGEGWEETRLGELASFKNGLNFSRNSSGQTLPVVGVGDFQDNFYVPMDVLETATIDGELETNYSIKKDDILTVRSNGSKHLIGRCMLVPEVSETASYSGFVIRIRFDTKILSPRFLLHFMKSRRTVSELTRGGGGANINNINQGKLSALKATYPTDTKEQERFADALDEVNRHAERLETIYTHKLSNLDELKQSLLQKAFTGQLTANESFAASVAPASLDFPATIEGISTTDLHAGILALAYRQHESPKTSHFGRVKGEKIVHLIENHIGIDLERSPVKDAAGPNDFGRIQTVEARAKKAGFFAVAKKDDRYELTPKSKFEDLIDKTERCLADQLTDVMSIINQMAKMSTRQAEILATSFAAWNNLLIENKDFSDEAIVYEARENWHPKKLNIEPEKFVKAIRWMREQGIVPTGRGKKVAAKTV